MKTKLKVFIIAALSIVFFPGTLPAQSFLGGKVDLKSYAGTWKYESENETVILRLRDTIAYYSRSGFKDTCVVGAYCYTRNDSILVNNMDIFWSNDRPMKMPVYCFRAKKDAMGNIFVVHLYFDDTKTGKTSSDCKITYALGRRAPELTWHLIDEGDTIIWDAFGSDDPEYNEAMRKKKLPGWSVPNDITFVKVE